MTRYSGLVCRTTSIRSALHSGPLERLRPRLSAARHHVNEKDQRCTNHCTNHVTMLYIFILSPSIGTLTAEKVATVMKNGFPNEVYTPGHPHFVLDNLLG